MCYTSCELFIKYSLLFTGRHSSSHHTCLLTLFSVEYFQLITQCELLSASQHFNKLISLLKVTIQILLMLSMIQQWYCWWVCEWAWQRSRWSPWLQSLSQSPWQSSETPCDPALYNVWRDEWNLWQTVSPVQHKA